MTQVVPHGPQIGAAVGHMRSGGVAQPVRGGLFEQIRLENQNATATAKDSLADISSLLGQTVTVP